MKTMFLLAIMSLFFSPSTAMAQPEATLSEINCRGNANPDILVCTRRGSVQMNLEVQPTAEAQRNAGEEKGKFVFCQTRHFEPNFLSFRSFPPAFEDGLVGKKKIRDKSGECKARTRIPRWYADLSTTNSDLCVQLTATVIGRPSQPTERKSEITQTQWLYKPVVFSGGCTLSEIRDRQALASVFEILMHITEYYDIFAGFPPGEEQVVDGLGLDINGFRDEVVFTDADVVTLRTEDVSDRDVVYNNNGTCTVSTTILGSAHGLPAGTHSWPCDKFVQ